ncbi:MAG: CCA tRNA nucleotidyltransferase [Candidatus Peribacteraceae bacterium]
MPISPSIIDRLLATSEGSAAFEVSEKLLSAGYECYWVGGAVRDMLLENLPKDIDMTTSAAPEQIEDLFPKSDDKGKAFGSIVASHKGHTFEITTYREDDDITDGRKPASVRFGSKEQDAKRRDATVNAIYFHPVSGDLFDPCKGETDLRERLVRFIGDPEVRIKQDALRLLRLVRLRATLSGQYEPKTYEALKKSADRIATLSGTRVFEEIEKILFCPHPEIAFEDLYETGILEYILPELAVCKGVAQPHEYHHEGDVWNHLMHVTTMYTEDHGPDVRLAALFHDIGKPDTFVLKERIRFDHHAEVSSDISSKILKRLQMSAEREKKIHWLIRHHMMMASFATLTEERKAYWYFHPWFQELLQLFYLDAAGTVPGNMDFYQSIVTDYDLFLNAHPRPEKPLLTGHDIMEILGLTPSEQVGKLSQALHDAQVRKEVTTKAEAIAFLKKVAG